MNGLIAAGFIAVAVALVFLTTLAVRLRTYRAASPGPGDGENLSSFSLVCYDPMERLVSSEDAEFLATLPGYRRELGARLRRNRRRIFRIYLRELAADFHRLHAAARQLAVNSPAEQSQLVGVLMRQQAAFWRSMLLIEARLLIPGLAPLEVRRLVQAVESMRADLERFAPAAAA